MNNHSLHALKTLTGISNATIILSVPMYNNAVHTLRTLWPDYHMVKAQWTLWGGKVSGRRHISDTSHHKCLITLHGDLSITGTSWQLSPIGYCLNTLRERVANTLSHLPSPDYISVATEGPDTKEVGIKLVRSRGFLFKIRDPDCPAQHTIQKGESITLGCLGSLVVITPDHTGWAGGITCMLCW